MKAIYLTPVGTIDEEILVALETSLWHAFGFDVRRTPAMAEPDHTFDRERNQYSSTAILRELVKQPPPDALRILAVTEKDLFIPMLSFIFGQAQLNGTVSIVSLARLRQEFYTLPANRYLLVGRIIKEALHELGHTFGLIHCVERRCPMSLATNIQQLDLKGSDFCYSCSTLVRQSTALLRSHMTDELPTEKRQ